MKKTVTQSLLHLKKRRTCTGVFIPPTGVPWRLQQLMCKLSHVPVPASLALRPLPCTWTVGCQMWLCASFATVSFSTKYRLGQVLGGNFWNHFPEGSDSSPETPLFSLWPSFNFLFHPTVCEFSYSSATNSSLPLSLVVTGDGSRWKMVIRLPITMSRRAAGLFSMPGHLPAEARISFPFHNSWRILFPKSLIRMDCYIVKEVDILS